MLQWKMMGIIWNYVVVSKISIDFLFSPLNLGKWFNLTTVKFFKGVLCEKEHHLIQLESDSEMTQRWLTQQDFLLLIIIQGMPKPCSSGKIIITILLRDSYESSLSTVSQRFGRTQIIIKVRWKPHDQWIQKNKSNLSPFFRLFFSPHSQLQIVYSFLFLGGVFLIPSPIYFESIVSSQRKLVLEPYESLLSQNEKKRCVRCWPKVPWHILWLINQPP